MTGLVRLMPPSGPVRPGSYDFSFESYFDGIGASGFFLRGPELAATSDPPPPIALFRASVERARERHRKPHPRPHRRPRGRDRRGAGRRRPRGHSRRTSTRRCAAPASTTSSRSPACTWRWSPARSWALLRAGFALFPDFASRRPVKKYAAALAIAGLAGYLFISGAEVAAQRSFIMLAVMLTAVLFDRAALTLRNLAIAAIVVIALSPHEVVGPSFQMSFAATAALVGAYAAWSDWRADHPRPAASRPVARRAGPCAIPAARRRRPRRDLASLRAARPPSTPPGISSRCRRSASSPTSPPCRSSRLSSCPSRCSARSPCRSASTGRSSMSWVWAFRPPSPSRAGFPSARRPTSSASCRRRPSRVLTIALLIATICSTWLRVAAVPVALVGLLLLDRPPAARSVRLRRRPSGGLALGDGAHRRQPRASERIHHRQLATRPARRQIVRPEGKQERSVSAGNAGTASLLSGPAPRLTLTLSP